MYNAFRLILIVNLAEATLHLMHELLLRDFTCALGGPQYVRIFNVTSQSIVKQPSRRISAITELFNVDGRTLSQLFADIESQVMQPIQN
jgi:hypothetical protein